MVILTSDNVQECRWDLNAGCAGFYHSDIPQLLGFFLPFVIIFFFLTFLYLGAEQFDKSAFELEIKTQKKQYVQCIDVKCFAVYERMFLEKRSIPTHGQLGKKKQSSVKARVGKFYFYS